MWHYVLTVLFAVGVNVCVYQCQCLQNAAVQKIRTRWSLMAISMPLLENIGCDLENIISLMWT